jgi:hypothetical protein
MIQAQLSDADAARENHIREQKNAIVGAMPGQRSKPVAPG